MVQLEENTQNKKCVLFFGIEDENEILVCFVLWSWHSRMIEECRTLDEVDFYKQV